MNVYLGHSMDAATLHFEHEECPACSLGRDKGGRLTRHKYEWWRENGRWLPDTVPAYDKSKREIVEEDIKYRSFPTTEAATARFDALCFLHCSRFPDCKYAVPINRSVLLDDPDLLADAQIAYRTAR